MAEFAVVINPGYSKSPENARQVGDILAVKDEDDIFYTWADMLLRGTSGMMMPFSPRLYDKYFDRTMTVRQPNGAVFRKKIAACGVTARAMTAKAPRGVSYHDVPKMKLRSVARDVLEGELKESMPLELLGTHGFSDGKSVMETWPWGRRELSRVLTVWVPDGEFGETEEHPPPPLRGGTPFKGGIRDMKCLKRVDGKGFERRWTIDWKKHGKTLGLETRIVDLVKQGRRSAGNYLLRFGLDPEMTLAEVAERPQIPLPNRFFVNPGKGEVAYGG